MDFKKLEDAHYRFQMGMYFSGMEKIEGATLLYNDKIEDFFWSFATEVNIEESKINDLIERVKDFYVSRNRKPSFYVTPQTKPQNLSEILENNGFKVEYNDAWMVHEKQVSVKEPENFSIKEVENEEEIKTFINVFNQVYGGPITEDEPYGGLSPAYGECILESFIKPREGKKIIHYLGFLENKPVGIGTLIFDGEYSAIYNVGTSPEHKRKGVGSAISLRAVADSLKNRNKILFLQTEQGSYMKKFYEELGFSTKFVGKGYVIS